MLAVDFTDVVDAADIRMADPQRHPHLVQEAGKTMRVLLDALRQELQCHGLAELEIVGAVDLAHAALAEQGSDFVVTEGLSDQVQPPGKNSEESTFS